ncbi:metal-dependent transcriptional regulator [Allonocardiopsis opalescens]|uniref:Manganese transport regulator n=1 Tax=Allonocardiopsis opalescens TaxID=1144618 RepID=A0A2T0QEM1_9ACTN|nr:metal-dependent transcriptional regulator [Allonocardiopsis opalescens]PRY02369.1 DtxR family iron (metal) dependent repressor [Allonocardiopsis opalescens]
MTTSGLTPTAQDYLKVIWGAQEWSDEPVTTSALAERLGVSTPTVSEAVKRLAAKGLVSHPRYGSIALTESGRRAALDMVRRHRLLETFLVTYLGYGWDEVHEEAEILEHAVSAAFVDRLERRLGRPTRDPHGDPIPSRDGELPELPAVSLCELAEGAAGQVARVSDADAELLRYLSGAGIGLDGWITVVRHQAAAGVLTVEVDGRRVDLGLPAARAVWVVRK